ncbi:FAR1-related protein [Striga asiatica]|uniref:FAR1-related protein n=1 Tax=Striga asiatica TaxID=4170 RepID=A0A5A7QXN8_STRAF|nr:FAR1-related protein [Striga asiatica]
MELSDTQPDAAPIETSKHHQLVITPGGTKYWIPHCDDAIRPHIGQRFKGLNEAVDFYMTYASTVGFDVRNSTLVKAIDNTTVLWKYLVCSREGFKKHPNTGQMVPDVGRVRRRRVSNRVGCNARIVLRVDGKDGNKTDPPKTLAWYLR